MTAEHQRTLRTMLKQFIDSHNDERAEALGTVLGDYVLFSHAIVRLFDGDMDKARDYISKLGDGLTAEARYGEIDEWSL